MRKEYLFFSLIFPMALSLFPRRGAFAWKEEVEQKPVTVNVLKDSKN